MSGLPQQAPLSSGAAWIDEKKAVPAHRSHATGHSAFEQMVANYQRIVHRTALRLTRHTEDAEDLVQDTLVRAWRSRDTFRPETNAKAWLLRILRNANVDRFRAGRRTVPTVPELDEHDQAFTVCETPESLVLADSMDAELLDALRALPERFRTCLILADLKGVSQTEIAKGLGVPPGTVMSRLYRARHRLQGRLQASVKNRRLIREVRADVTISHAAPGDMVTRS